MQNPYAPPSAASSAPVPGEYVVPIDEVNGRVSVLPGVGFFSAGVLLLDGKPAENLRRQGYRLPLRDGTTVWAKLQQSWTRPVPIVIVNGRKYELGPKVGVGYAVMIFLPFALVPIGGLLGGLFGGLGCMLNRKVAFSEKSGWFRVPVMLGVVLGTFALYFLLAGSLFALRQPH